MILREYFQKSQEKVVIQRITDTTYVVDTISTVVPYERLSKETIVIHEKAINYDSLIQEAFEEWKVFQKDTLQKTFVVTMDTTTNDSLVSAKVSFHSPLPIHPKSYFTSDFRVKIPVIKETVTVEKQAASTPLLTFGLHLGGGYTTSNKVDGYVGIGLSLNLLGVL